MPNSSTGRPVFPVSGKRVFVAGHAGMVGAACVRALQAEGCDVLVVPKSRLDLLRQADVEQYLFEQKPDAVIVAAARVGGIVANNSYPADFLYQNLLIETNLIGAAHSAGIDRLLFLGSSCIYPREAPQPISEDALLTGPLEPTNEWYAVAKIAGVKLCQAFRRQHGRDYISAMPCNLYGPGDYFHPERSHVIPALLQRFRNAARERIGTVTCWGTGKPRREFLHVDDLARACVMLLRDYSDESPINVGSGEDVTLRELATELASVTGFAGEILWDSTRPDGVMQKRMDVSRIMALGWRPERSLRDGLIQTYHWFLDQHTLRT